MLKILFFAVLIGLVLRGVRSLFSPVGPARRPSAPGPRRSAGPGGPSVKDVPETDYRWDQEDGPPE